MAIMHLTVKNGLKGKGAAHAQYIERDGKYSNREDALTSESGNMPDWVNDKPLDFWKAADKNERANGRSYKELEVSLPRELNNEQQIELVREFAKNVLGNEHAYTWAIHQPKARDGETNPHVHLMFSERTNDGFTRDEEQFFKRYNPKNPGIGGAGKDRSFTHKSFVYAIRQEWAETVNHKMSELGLGARIDHRSYKDMNVDLESQNAKRLFAKSDNVEQVAAFTMSGEIREKQKTNGERIIENPLIALNALTAMQSTFSQRDLEKFVFNHTDGLEQYTTAYNAILSSNDLQVLDDVKHRFTSKDLLQLEQKIIAQVERLNGSNVGDKKNITEKLAFSDTARSRTFNLEQESAFNVLSSNAQIAVVNGAAGTGKSYVLSAVNEGYKKAGYKVIGAALQGSTTQNMERDAGIESRTIASLLMRIEREDSEPNIEKILTEKTVLIIDEAGMVGSRDMQKLLERVEHSGAKIRMVGDAYQLNAVSAGSAFSQIQETLHPDNKAELVQIMRQRDERMRDASVSFSSHDIANGLAVYDELEKIHGLETQQGAREYIVSQWAASDKEKIMLAYTNTDVNAMNKAARMILHERGVLGEDVRASTPKGLLDLAQGDEIIFREPSKALGVLNGTRGTIEQIETVDGRAQSLQVRLNDNARCINVDLSQYNSLNHGYASTIHASQGVTVNESFLLVSGAMNANLAYVGATRHRDDMVMAYSREQFKDLSDVMRQLSKTEVKTFSADFDVASERDKSLVKITERETLAERMKERDHVITPWASTQDRGKEVSMEQSIKPKETEYQARDRAILDKVEAEREADLQAKIDKLNKIERDVDIPARRFTDVEMVQTLRQNMKESGKITDERELGTYGNSCRAGVGDYVKIEADYSKKEAGLFGRKTEIERGTELNIKSFELDVKTGGTWMNAEITNGEHRDKIVRIDLSVAQSFKHSDRYMKFLQSKDGVRKNVIKQLNSKEISSLRVDIERQQRQREAEQKAIVKMRERKLDKQHDKGRGFSK